MNNILYAMVFSLIMLAPLSAQAVTGVCTACLSLQLHGKEKRESSSAEAGYFR